MTAEKWPKRLLQQFAIAISAFSMAYNIAEGVLAVYYGYESDSFSLFFFGLQSFIEVISAGLVLWRFLTLALPGDEKNINLSESELYKERVATISIGILFALLAIGAIITACYNLSRKEQPEDSNDTLIISSSSLGIMILIWLPKPWLSAALNSSAMRGEAKCSLSCIYITTALFVGSIIFKFWPKGWWVDSAFALILTYFFFKESVEMLMWGMSKSFSGGCCNECSSDKNGAGKSCKIESCITSCESGCEMTNCKTECAAKGCGTKDFGTEGGAISCAVDSGVKCCESKYTIKSCDTKCEMKSCEVQVGKTTREIGIGIKGCKADTSSGSCLSKSCSAAGGNDKTRKCIGSNADAVKEVSACSKSQGAKCCNSSLQVEPAGLHFV